jgi:hypothetical protein
MNFYDIAVFLPDGFTPCGCKRNTLKFIGEQSTSNHCQISQDQLLPQ